MIKEYEKELKEEIPYGSNAAQKQGLDNDVIPEPYGPPSSPPPSLPQSWTYPPSFYNLNLN